jgi:hypothetical protein
MVPQIGKVFIVTGSIFILFGLILTFIPHFSFLRLGRLPGDIIIKRDNFSFYFPITTSIVLSLLLTLIFALFFRR